MQKTVVVYKSKYGTTQTYAKWIAEDAQADIFQAGEIDLTVLLKYDAIVYCGGMYAGGILGFGMIRKNYRKLPGKRLIVVAVGASLKGEAAHQELKRRNLTPEMQDTVQFFTLRGGMNYKKMRFLDRFMMYLMVQSIKAKAKKGEDLDDDSKGVLATYGKVVDFTNRAAIAPVVNAIKGA